MKSWQMWLIITALLFFAPFVYGFVSLWRRRRQVERETLQNLEERCAKLEMEMKHGGPLTNVEQSNFVTFGKEICQSSSDDGRIDFQVDRKSLIVGHFGKQKCQLSANRRRASFPRPRNSIETKRGSTK